MLTKKNKVNGRTVLHYAARSGYKHVIDFLMSQVSINPNIQDNLGYTPLMSAVAVACHTGFSSEGALTLLKYHAVDSNIAAESLQESYNTPLKLAKQWNKFLIVEAIENVARNKTVPSKSQFINPIVHPLISFFTPKKIPSANIDANQKQENTFDRFFPL